MSFNLILSKQFKEDIILLKKADNKLPGKVWELINDILNHIEHPELGLGKPELLKGNMSGYYSRRIDDRHRLIYIVKEGVLSLISCYGHYDD